MNFGLILFVTALFLNNCTARVPENGNDAALPAGAVQQRPKLQLSDLNADVLFIVLDLLDMYDLVHLDKCFPVDEVYSVAVEVFRKKANDYAVSFFSREISYGQFEYITGGRKSVSFNETNKILHILTRFGGAIKTLYMYNREFPQNDSAVINQYINKYGSEYLVELFLDDLCRDTLNQYAVPFQKLEVLEFYGSKGIQYSQMPLNQLFPKLRRISFRISSGDDYSFFNIEMPNLIDLEIDVSDKAEWEQFHQFEGMMYKNPQIKAFKTMYFPAQVVRDIEWRLPNIENVSVYYFDYKYDHVHYDKVKNLHFYGFDRYNPKTIEKLTCPRLEYLYTEWNQLHIREWTEFFRRVGGHLRKLTLSMSHIINNIRSINVELVQAIVNELPNLTEIEFITFDHTKAEAICQLLERHGNLRKLHVVMRWMEESEFTILEDRIRDKWEIVGRKTYKSNIYLWFEKLN